MREQNSLQRFAIGTAQDVAFDTAAWGPAAADVDLSVACMFEHEADGAAVAGGLLALDRALGGLLTRMRGTGAFRGQEMETLLVSLPPAPIPARAVLVIGLGQPATLTADVLRRAARAALREAVRLGAASLAFAPSVLDAGHTDNAGLDMPHVMLDGMLGALAAEQMLADGGFARPLALRSCTFDVGAARLEGAARAFGEAFGRLGGAGDVAGAYLGNISRA